MSGSDPSSASPRVEQPALRPLAATVIALAVLGVAAGTRAVLVPTRTPVARPSATAGTTNSVRETPASIAASVSASPSPGFTSTLDAASHDAASQPAVVKSAQSLDAADASNAAESTADVPDTPQRPVPLVPTVPPAAGPIGRGQPARVALDWRMLIARAGITFAAQEITDASSGTSAMSGAESFRTHSNVTLSLDLEQLAGISGLTLYAQHKTKTGRNGSGEGSFVQNFSNIDADDFRAVGEVFVEQRVLQDRLRIKAGRLDFNTEFAATDHVGRS